MKQRILFIGGEQDGQLNLVSERVEQIKLDVFPVTDLRALSGIIPHPKPLYSEIYHRREVDGKECFVLIGTAKPDLSKQWGSMNGNN